MSEQGNYEPSGYVIREATPDDLDAIAGFEVEIALVSFGDEAITDAGLHRRRVAGALGKAGEITLVAAAQTAPAQRPSARSVPSTAHIIASSMLTRSVHSCTAAPPMLRKRCRSISTVVGAPCGLASTRGRRKA